MALTWHEATSGMFRLVGNNKLYLKLKWAEEIFGNTNRIHVKFIARSYSISGNWNCRLRINGVDKGAPRVGIYHGTNSSMGETVVRSEYQDITNGATRITIYGAIEGMDYYDVDMGSGSTHYYNPSFSHTISISVPNSPPPTPSLKCLNRDEGSKYLAEDKLELECSQVTDPNGNTVTYAIYGRAIGPNGSQLSFGDSSGCVHWSTNRRASIGITQYPRGTRFYLRARAFDTYNAGSENSTEINNIWRNNKPNKVSGFSPSTGYFNTDSFTINWSNPGDADKSTVSYELHVSKNGGAYSIVTLSSKYATSYTQNISQDAEGTYYRFKIWSYDELTWSDPYESSYYYKNKKPTAPTNIFPNSGFYLGDVSLTWNRSTDPEGRGIKDYEVFINNESIGRVNETNGVFQIPTSDPEGTAYTVSVQATDYDNKVGDRGYASGSFYKASSPKAPSWIETNGVYHENSINLSWESISSNGYGTRYELECSENGGQYNIIYSGTVASYVHNISNIARGTSFVYRVKAINSFEQQSEYKVNSTCYRNRLPQTPRIAFPTQDSTIYNVNPRICFEVFNELDGQNQKIFVDCNGTVFNNVDNPSMFSNSTYNDSGKKIVFYSNLKVGANTIKVYTNDGTVNSEVAKRTFNIKTNNILCEGEFITPTIFNEILSKANDVRLAFGLSKYLFTEIPQSKLSYIKPIYVRDLRNAISACNDTINNYDVSNPNKNKITWMQYSATGMIYANIFKEIIDVINSI